MTDTERETDGSGPPPTTIAAATVSVKLPPFWPSDPEIWFAQVEATFTTRRITSEKTRFDYVIASLSPEVATEIRDLILKPPETTPYKVLKEQLICRTTASEQRRLQQLFNAEAPNVCMVLASTKASTTLEEIAELADKVVEVV